MNLKVKKYLPEYKLKWDNFIDSAKNSTFLFKRDFMEYHKQRFVDYSLMVFEKDEIVALLPANLEDELTLISHAGLTYGGLVINGDIKLNSYLSIFNELLLFLKENNISILKYKAIPIFYTNLPAQEEEYVMFLLKANIYRVDTALTIKNSNILNYQNRRLRSVKKSDKFEFIIKEDNNFKIFWKDLLAPNLKKKYNKEPVHSITEIENLASKFPNNIHQFNIFKNDKIVAGVTIFETVTTAHFQYIASNDLGRKTGALDKLTDYLIAEIFNHKKYIDFGISNENEGTNINHGLLDWKEGFGGRTYVQKFYKIKTSNYGLLKDVII